MNIAITGHRPDKLGGEYDLIGPVTDGVRKNLQAVIDTQIFLKGKENITLISGMALGVDTIWAELAISNSLKLIAAIPCQGQERTWPPKSQERYNNILTNPLTTVVMVSEEPYHPSLMHKRNVWMVDNSDMLVAVWDGSDGGTYNCVDYARRMSKPRILIDPNLYP